MWNICKVEVIEGMKAVSEWGLLSYWWDLFEKVSLLPDLLHFNLLLINHMCTIRVISPLCLSNYFSALKLFSWSHFFLSCFNCGITAVGLLPAQMFQKPEFPLDIQQLADLSISHLLLYFRFVTGSHKGICSIWVKWYLSLFPRSFRCEIGL